MPGFTGPNVGFVWGYSPHDDGWGVGSYNPGFAALDTLLFATIIDTLNDPPGSPVNGDRYIVGDSPTGAWAGQAKKIAVYLSIGGPAWVFYTPKLAWRAFDQSTQAFKRYTGTVWIDEVSATNSFEFTSLANRDILVYDSTETKFINKRLSYVIGMSSDPSALLDDSQELLYHRFAAAVTFPANFGEYNGRTSRGSLSAVATGTSVFAIEKAESATILTFSEVGTMTYLGSGTTPTFSSSNNPVNFAAGDALRIVAPTTADATLKGPYATIVGFET